jgi:hypothetical protein
MCLQRSILACGIVLCFFVGCRSNGTPSAVPGAAPTPIQREMGKLAFLAYVGDNLTDPYPQLESRLHECLRLALQEEASHWKLAWGPAVYRFPDITKLADNMMYVVRNEKNPSEFTIVVRGTNPKALLDWLVEDFDVVDQVAWNTGPGQPKISKGASEGITILQRMVPTTDPQSTLSQFLATITASSPGTVQINFAGHSLGGALAPTLALALYDSKAQWDPQGKASFAVYPLAGPTAGNADFASYYDSILEGVTYRMWNPFDVVPLAWNHESMGKVADLYEPLTRANPIERGLIDGLRSLVEDKAYAQIDPTQPPLPGVLYAGQPGQTMDWASEAGWQHHCGYECALGIDIDSDCPSTIVECDCSNVPAATSR